MLVIRMGDQDRAGAVEIAFVAAVEVGDIGPVIDSNRLKTWNRSMLAGVPKVVLICSSTWLDMVVVGFCSPQILADQTKEFGWFGREFRYRVADGSDAGEVAFGHRYIFHRNSDYCIKGENRMNSRQVMGVGDEKCLRIKSAAYLPSTSLSM